MKKLSNVLERTCPENVMTMTKKKKKRGREKRERENMGHVQGHNKPKTYDMAKMTTQTL